LDEEREGDEVVDLQGYTVVINKGLLNTAKPIAIDFTERGFSLDSSMKFEKPEGGGCSGCAGC
ncbi:MAG: IscA/HesB family protein, partial [Desulfovibrionales bacterium]